MAHNSLRAASLYSTTYINTMIPVTNTNFAYDADYCSLNMIFSRDYVIYSKMLIFVLLSDVRPPAVAGFRHILE